VKADISDIVGAFPDARIAVLVARGLRIAQARSAGLDAAIAEAEQAASAAYDLERIGQIPMIQVWRQAYKGFGIKSTSYRSSVERLLRNVLRGRGLARINGFVDAYNLVSLVHLMPVGADDLDRVSGDIAFRFARQGESFIALGAEPPDEDPPKPGEVVYADAEKVLCRRWNWYQDARSAVSPASTRVVVTLQAGAIGDLEAAAREACERIVAECGGEAAFVVLDAASPRADLPLMTPHPDPAAVHS
jgi:DNA/RNA-binding domain of Phe-tRNA-synthetase-like protein